MADGNQVGKINVGLDLNDKNFLRQIKNDTKVAEGFGNVLKKVGGIVAGALSVKAIIDFSKSCLELGSNLAEVQNVVDTVFPNMSQQANEWAKSTMHQFGLSETVAKNYMSTLGAMSKAFGYSEQEAFAQATALTGLAGDMASFYNKTTDETFNAVKAIYSGETEVLKQYGIVMTQTALQEYALTQGINGNINALSEKEKVALRLGFVQEKLAMASGDFAKTESSWANQTRILSLQWDSFKATIGQGLISLLTPIINQFNAIMESVNNATSAIVNFMMSLAGVTSAVTGSSGIAESMASASESAESLNTNMGGAGGGAKKLKSTLMGFDKLNVLNKQSSGGGGGGSSITPQTISGLDTAGSKFDEIVEQLGVAHGLLGDIANDFSTGFSQGFGSLDTSMFSANLQNIKSQLENIFTNVDVQNSAMTFISKLSTAMGQAVGTIASIGAQIGMAIVGAVSLFLSEHSGDISSFLASEFSIAGQSSEIVGNLSLTVGGIISEVFGSYAPQRIVESLMSIPAIIAGNVILLGSQFGLDLMQGFSLGITENQGAISEALTGVFNFISSLLDSVEQIVTDCFSAIKNTYYTYIQPTIRNVSQAFSHLLGVILEFWNTYVKPLLDQIAKGVNDLWNNHLKKAFEKVIEFVGKVIEVIGVLWADYLEPIIAWVIQNILPVIMPIVSDLIDAVFDILGAVGDMVSGIFEVLGGLMDFIIGVLTGDWMRAWDGIKEIFEGAFDFIYGILDGASQVFADVFNGIVDVIKGAINIGISAVEGFINGCISGINTILRGINSIGDATGLGHIELVPQVSLPRLAQGGFVEANTPQLAVIGDNRHEGEIVAPESKISEAVAKGMAGLAPMIASAVANAVRNATPRGSSDANIVVELDGEVLYSRMMEYQGRANSRSGGRS